MLNSGDNTATRVKAGRPRKGASGEPDAGYATAGEPKRVDTLLEFKTVFESANDILLLLDDKGKILDVNQRLKDIGGYEREELLSKNIRSLRKILTKKSLPVIMRNFMKRMVGFRVAPYQVEMIKKNGELIDIEINAVAIRKNGKIAGDLAILKDITERKRMEAKVTRANTQLQILQELTASVHSTLDLETVFKQVTDGTVNSLGYTMAIIITLNEAKELWEVRAVSTKGRALSQINKILGQSLKKMAFPADAEFSAPVRRLLSGRTVVSGNLVELTYPLFSKKVSRSLEHLGGKECYVLVPLKVAQEVVGALITACPREEILEEEQKTIETFARASSHAIINAQLHTKSRQAEELYRSLANSSPVGVYIIQDGRFRFVNPQFQKVTGYNEAELMEMNPSDIVHEEDRDRVRADAIAMVKGERALPYEFRSVVKSGGVKWCMETATSIEYQGRRATLGNFMDISESKLTEEKIKYAAQEWRNTFDSIADSVFITDRDFIITRMNKAYAHAVNIPIKETIGMHCYEALQCQSNRCAQDCPHQQTLATREPATVEFPVSEKGVYLVESTSPVFDNNGEVTHIIHIARDITLQKQMEQQLIMTDRLASIGELVSGIAHELNNPLTSVIGFSSLLKDADVPPEVKRDLEIICSEAERTAVIIRNLLTFARKHDPERQLSQVNNIIDEVLKLRSYEHKVSNITVHRCLDQKLPEIMVDYYQMQQVFLNVIVNAEQAMLAERGGGVLDITSECQGNLVRISFVDNGPGISPENINNIFNPFFTTKEVGKGTGLGLSICHGIVSSHGGHILARSNPGKGATFVIELPVTS